MILVGKAIGGPRHKVKLMCPDSWDGRVMLDQYAAYPGRYVYGHCSGASRRSRVTTTWRTWIWKPDTPQPKTKKDSQLPARKRQAFAGYQYS